MITPQELEEQYASEFASMDAEREALNNFIRKNHAGLLRHEAHFYRPLELSNIPALVKELEDDGYLATYHTCLGIPTFIGLSIPE